MLQRHVLILMSFTMLSQVASAAVRCEALYKHADPTSASLSTEAANRQNAPTPVRNALSLKDAWTECVTALDQVNHAIYNKTQYIEALTVAMLAHEFIWINGEPGGAKTYLSRMMFEVALKAIPELEKKTFVLQFHKLISEGKISGFQKFEAAMKEGKFELETKTSLAGDDFLYMIADEAEKASPPVMNALLSVMNERKVFAGSKVMDLVLASGVLTSNKPTGKFVQDFFGDRASAEALLDRMAVKAHMANQQVSPEETAAMYNMKKNPRAITATLPLIDLEGLLNKVQISQEMMSEIVSISRSLDTLVTDKFDKSRDAVRNGQAEVESFPANQFSNRSMRRLIKILKANLIANQLVRGVPFEQMKLTLDRNDLMLLAKAALYIGPSEISLKTYMLTEMKDGKPETDFVEAKNRYGTVVKLRAQLSPYENQLQILDATNKQVRFVFTKKDGHWVQVFRSNDFARLDWNIDPSTLAKLEARIQTVITENKIDPRIPQFEVSDTADRLVALGTQEEQTNLEQLSMKDDLVKFAEILNQHFERDAPAKALPPQEPLLPVRTEKEIRAFRREMMNASTKERTARYYDWMAYEIRALKQRFMELDYSIEAHLTGLLASTHLYVFGPPGGAKTSLAEVILKAEIKKLNADEIDKFVTEAVKGMGHDENFMKVVLQSLRKQSPKQFDRFLLQFHKLLPEGVLIGFPKIEKQLNEGIEEIETESSMANQKFLFAILDEVDKAAPPTLTALLSILNEREVFVGSQVIKTGLRTAILTSNKMPSELLDSYYEDRSSGTAIMARAINKVFVSNKLSTNEALTQFLMNIESGISTNWKGLLGMSEIAPLVKEVEFEGPEITLLCAQIQKKFSAMRKKVEQDTRKANQMDPREFPDYYVFPGGAVADRDFGAFMDQLPARFVVHQLINGVPFKDVRTKFEIKDLAIFFEGLGYWAPQKIEAGYDSEGKLTFSESSPVLDSLLNAGILDSRVKFHVTKFREEARDYVQVLNSVVGEFVDEYKAQIIQYPELFPSLFAAGHRPTE